MVDAVLNRVQRIARISEVAADEVRELLVSNQLAGADITPVLGKSPVDPIYKQLRLLDIYEQDPDAARAIASNHVAGFHASRSGGLLSTLRHGLLPAAEAPPTRGDVPIFHGERVFSQGKQADISYADWT